MIMRLLYRCRECGETFSTGTMPEGMSRLELARFCAAPQRCAISATDLHEHKGPLQTPGIYRADFLGVRQYNP